MNWPKKTQREYFEINEFIKAYDKLYPGCQLTIQNKSEQPDYSLKDKNDNCFGVELTSVYLDNSSVPEKHMKEDKEPIGIPYCEETINKYFVRIKESIEQKIIKANSYYSRSLPLLLAIYINEYISIYIDPEGWDNFIKNNEDLFKKMSPFKEIVLFSLQNNSCLSIRIENNNLITTNPSDAAPDFKCKES